ncbi:hypothetical protein [Streptomyces sp. NPDC001568]
MNVFKKVAVASFVAIAANTSPTAGTSTPSPLTGITRDDFGWQ